MNREQLLIGDGECGGGSDGGGAGLGVRLRVDQAHRWGPAPGHRCPELTWGISEWWQDLVRYRVAGANTHTVSLSERHTPTEGVKRPILTLDNTISGLFSAF